MAKSLVFGGAPAMGRATQMQDLMRDLARFLGDHEQIDSGLEGAVLLLARYDETLFSRALFDALGVVLPRELVGANDRRLCEFLAGRLLAARAIALLGLPPAQIGRLPDRRPVWPHGLSGSISHARGFAACLVTPGGHPGVDVETPSPGQSLAALRRHALSAKDLALIGENDPGLVFLTFSAKETLFKALFPLVGRSFGFDAAELVARPAPKSTPETVSLRLTKDLSPHLSAGSVFLMRFRHRNDHVLTWMQAPAP